ALHWYEEVGLLEPSDRTFSGHRLYSERDVVRLLQIRSLRQLGFSLDEIREFLKRRAFSPRRVLEKHAARLREEAEAKRRLCDRLEALAEKMRSAEDVPVEEFLSAIEEMTMFEKYYTPEQLKELKERAEKIGPARIKEVEAEWPKLMAEVRAEMEKGTDPS